MRSTSLSLLRGNNMNNLDAKEVLKTYRPGVDDENDPDIIRALTLVRQDPNLAQWHEQQQAFNAGVRETLRRIEPPAGLKEKILAGQFHPKAVLWWRRPELLAIAAAIAILIGLAVYWIPSSDQNTLATYRSRMARFALREYRMNLVTNDLNRIRSYLAEQGAPADYTLNPELEKLPGVGCALLKWQNQPVSLICFRLGRDDLLWLFVTDRTSVPGAPSTAAPQYDQVGKLATATWSSQGKTYLLGVIGDQQTLQKYL